MKKSRAAKDSQRGDCHEQKPTCTDPWKPVPTYYKALQRLPDFWAFILLEIPIKIKLRELIVAIRELNGSSIPMIRTFTQLGEHSSGDYNKQEMAPWPRTDMRSIFNRVLLWVCLGGLHSTNPSVEQPKLPKRIRSTNQAE
jgi:hypothetical protein